MINFHDLPTEDRAVDGLVQKMKESGYSDPDARRIVDAAGALVLSIFRGLDDRIRAETKDEAERTVMQSLVLHQMRGTAEAGLKVNLIESFVKMMGSGFR